MPDIKIPQLALPTGNSSETDVGSSTARSTGRPMGVAAAGATTRQHQPSRRPRRNYMRRNENKASAAPAKVPQSGTCSESDTTSSTRSHAVQVQPVASRKSRKILGRGPQRKQIQNSDSMTFIDAKDFALSSEPAACKTQANHYPNKNVRRSFGRGNCAKKPQPLKLTIHSATVNNPIVTKTHTSSNAIVTESNLAAATDTDSNLCNTAETGAEPTTTLATAVQATAPQTFDLEKAVSSTTTDTARTEWALTELPAVTTTEQQATVVSANEVYPTEPISTECLVPARATNAPAETTPLTELPETNFSAELASELDLRADADVEEPLNHNIEDTSEQALKASLEPVCAAFPKTDSTPNEPQKLADLAKAIVLSQPSLAAQLRERKATKQSRSSPSTPVKALAAKTLAHKRITSASHTPTKHNFPDIDSVKRQLKLATPTKKDVFKQPLVPTQLHDTKATRQLRSTPNTPIKSTEPKLLKKITSAPSTPTKASTSKTAATPQRQHNTTINSQYYRETILQYRAGKSVSQMDLKQARRSANYQLIKATVCANRNNEPITANTEGAGDAMGNSSDRRSFERKLYYVIHEQNPRYAGMRVLASVMLNAWRKRRIEVKQLSEQVDELKHQSVKAKNQLHVFNSLFRVEKKRNEQLTVQLNHKQGELYQLRANCDVLSSTIINLKTDLSHHKELLDKKAREYEELDGVLNEVKSDLFKAMSMQREMQTELSNEQRRVQELQNENKDLLSELNEQKKMAELSEQDSNMIIEEQVAELDEANKRIQYYEEEIEKYKCQEQKLRQSADSELKLREQITSLEGELQTLRKYVDATLSRRCKYFWNSTKDVPRGTILWLHWLAFYMLPATPVPMQPPPTLPFGLTLEKALSIIKR